MDQITNIRVFSTSLFFLMIRHPPRSPLFPSPTLFRSRGPTSRVSWSATCSSYQGRPRPSMAVRPPWGAWIRRFPSPKLGRSEEHTSELQSQSNLVCRLLLENKKQLQDDTAHNDISVNV